MALSFADFLERMKDPAAADLVRSIKNFIRQFEERPSGQAVDPEADSTQVQAFLAQSERAFRAHPVWRGCQPEVLDQAVEGLEKYVMSKVWRQTFGAWAEDRERDERYQRLMQALGFVDLPTLMGVPGVKPDDNLLALAQAEVLKMDRYKAPRDKLLCLVNVKTMVENIVGLAAKAGAAIGGADAFFPVFLFVVIRSRLPHLASNIEYVKRFRARARLSGQFDYMLANLESAAMYLDTVNYEHLSVSQETFLAHLAAAGIPEAHLELQRMREEADAAAALEAVAAMEAADADAAEAALFGEGPLEAGPQQHQQVQQAAAASGARAAASGAAAAQARHEQQVAAAAAAVAGDDNNVLTGLQLAEDRDAAPSPESSESLGLEPAQTSFPATPLGTAEPGDHEGLGSAACEGSLPALTPLGGGSQSPALLEPLTAGAEEADTAGRIAHSAAGAAVLLGSEEGLQAQQAQQGGSAAQRELSFEMAVEPQAAAVAVSAADMEQERQQQAAQAAAADAVAAAVVVQPYEEPPLIEEMVAEGTRHVLAAEAAGQLQQRYPFMYAQAEDLSVAEVEGVLVGYKELLLRYEALSRGLQQQLGLLPGTAPIDGGSSTSGSPAGAGGLSTSPGHRSKGQQAAQGFGSLVLTASFAGGVGHARRVISAPISVAAPVGGTADGSASGSADASPSGKWSPGGILQRISKGASAARRSMTPPRDRNSGGAAAAAEAARAAADATSRSPNSSHAASPGGKAGQPFFSTLFGSPKIASVHQQAPEQQAVPRQPQAATAVEEGMPGGQQPEVQQLQPAKPEADVDEAAPALADSSGEPVPSAPELSFGEGMLWPAGTPGASPPAAADIGDTQEAAPHAAAAGGIDQLLGGLAAQQQQQHQQTAEQRALAEEAPPEQPDEGAGASAFDLVQLGASRSCSQQAPAAPDAAVGPDLLVPLGGPDNAQPQPDGATPSPTHR